MARDPRKNSAFDSGMRGREKPAIQNPHGGTKGQEDSGKSGGESKQGPSTQVGNPDGVDLSAYSSGMRGPEKPKQKSASGDANKTPGGPSGGENAQGGGKVIGQPKGHDDAGQGARKGVNDAHLQAAAKGAHELGIPGNNTEDASQRVEPEGEAGILGDEDDTHINLRIPKASLKKKQSGLATN
jgi:hypothetical protein